MKTFILLFALISCSTTPAENETSLAWKGHSLSETENHPYFKTLKLSKQESKTNNRIWTYRDIGPGANQAHCKELGGCSSVAMLYCDYTFTEKDEKIVSLETWGQCHFPKKILAPKKNQNL